MRFTELDIAGAYLIDIEPHEDDRGFFARTYCAREFEQRGLVAEVIQCNTSYNAHRGTLRGLHYQAPPHAEVKLVRCTAGAIFDVLVDLRVGSPTFRKWRSADLSASNRRTMYVPPGVAHGFQTMEDHSEVFYQISTEYVASLSRGIRWNDPLIAVDWPLVKDSIVSPKDARLPLLEPHTAIN